MDLLNKVRVFLRESVEFFLRDESGELNLLGKLLSIILIFIIINTDSFYL